MDIEMKYVPLSFISSNEAIIKQLKNTIVFKTVLNEYNNLITLSDLIISTQYGYTASASKFGSHRLLRITDINDGSVNWETVPLCNCNRERTYLLNEGDVLIARTGNNISFLVGKEVPHNAIFASYLIRVVCDKTKLLREYLFKFLNSYAFWPQILQKQRGALLQNVNAKLMGQLLIPMCTIDKQKEIISGTNSSLNQIINDEINDIICTYNRKINISNEFNHQISLVKQLRQSFLREAMQGKLVKQNPNDEPAIELLKKIKAEKEKRMNSSAASGRSKKERELQPITEEEIPFAIPDNWSWCRLGEICNYGSSSKANPKDLKNNTWILDLEDIEKETSRLLTKIRFSERNSLSTKSLFNKGDVLYSKLRPYLDKVIVADEDGACTTEILPLKLFGNLDSYFLRYALKRSDFLSYVNSVTKGMKMPRLGTNEGKNALIPIPPLTEQKHIVEKLDQLMKYCDELEASIKESKTYNEQLLQQVLKEALKN